MIAALKGVSLEVRQGEIVALIGANGAGKSTTLMSISGIAGLQSGTVTYGGRVLTGLPPPEIVRRGVCQVPEGRRIFPRMTVRENLEMGSFLADHKACEVIGEKWTILILRELLMGSTHFNELQRGLSLISPTLLSKRLDALTDHGLVMKKKISGQKGYQYFPTEACTELLPIIRSMGEWGVRWASSSLTQKDYDIELLMLYLQRSIKIDKLPGKEAVVRFNFTDLEQFSDWWLVIQNDKVDACTSDPGKDVDVYFTTSVKNMVDISDG